MKKIPSFFCPDDGWEGVDPICPICSQPSESLDSPDGNAPRQEVHDDIEDKRETDPLDDFLDEEPTPPEEQEE